MKERERERERERTLIHAYASTHETRGRSAGFSGVVQPAIRGPSRSSRARALKEIESKVVMVLFFLPLLVAFRFRFTKGAREDLRDLRTVGFAANEARRR